RARPRHRQEGRMARVDTLRRGRRVPCQSLRERSCCRKLEQTCRRSMHTSSRGAEARRETRGSERSSQATIRPAARLVVLDHHVHKLDQMLADLLRADTLHAVARALEHHIEQVRREIRVFKTSLLAEPPDAFVFSNLVILNDAPRRMILLGELRNRVVQWGATALHRRK